MNTWRAWALLALILAVAAAGAIGATLAYCHDLAHVEWQVYS